MFWDSTPVEVRMLTREVEDRVKAEIEQRNTLAAFLAAEIRNQWVPNKKRRKPWSAKEILKGKRKPSFTEQIEAMRTWARQTNRNLEA